MKHEILITRLEKSLFQSSPTLQIDQIVKQAMDLTGYTREEIVGPSRSSNLVRVRHAIMHEAHNQGFSLTEIGRAMGGRDHTTVLNAIRKTNDRLKINHAPKYARTVAKDQKTQHGT